MFLVRIQVRELRPNGREKGYRGGTNMIMRRNAHDMGDKVLSLLSGAYLESYEIAYNPDDSATITVVDDEGSTFTIRITGEAEKNV